MNTGTSLIAVTSYFNPAGYESRLRNYRRFREHLSAPLLTVELVYNGIGELGPQDADFLVQVHVGDVMWQKERLLNLGLTRLPERYAHVAILDCDIVFLEDDWVEATVAALGMAPLVQPYSDVCDIHRHADISNLHAADVLLQRTSFARIYTSGGVDPRSFGMDTSGQYSPGHAWAARREVLCEGLYDGMILGSGDLAWAAAATGAWEDFIRAFSLSTPHANHFRAWAQNFHRRVQGKIGHVDGTLLHLWHGNLKDRAYETRYSTIRDFDFDPSTDIRKSPREALTWSTRKPPLHRAVRAYFQNRLEDGRPQ